METAKREISAKIATQEGRLYVFDPLVSPLLFSESDGPDSLLYVRAAKARRAEVRMKFQLEHLPENADQAFMIEVLGRLNGDDRYHGILLQLPVPKHLNDRLLELINSKDVDD